MCVIRYSRRLGVRSHNDGDFAVSGLTCAVLIDVSEKANLEAAERPLAPLRNHHPRGYVKGRGEACKTYSASRLPRSTSSGLSGAAPAFSFLTIFQLVRRSLHDERVLEDPRGYPRWSVRRHIVRALRVCGCGEANGIVAFRVS